MPQHSAGKDPWIFSPFASYKEKDTKALPEESHRGVISIPSGTSTWVSPFVFDAELEPGRDEGRLPLLILFASFLWSLLVAPNYGRTSWSPSER